MSISCASGCVWSSGWRRTLLSLEMYARVRKDLSPCFALTQALDEQNRTGIENCLSVKGRNPVSMHATVQMYMYRLVSDNSTFSAQEINLSCLSNVEQCTIVCCAQRWVMKESRPSLGWIQQWNVSDTDPAPFRNPIDPHLLINWQTIFTAHVIIDKKVAKILFTVFRLLTLSRRDPAAASSIWSA